MYKLGRYFIFLLILTSPIKIGVVLYGADNINAAVELNPLDTIFRALYLCLCILSMIFGLLSKSKIYKEQLLFIPFVVWGIIVIVIHDVNFSQYRQMFSFITWIVFFIACLHLLSWRDHKIIAHTLIGAVVINILMGVLAHIIGGGEMIGTLQHTGRFVTGGGGQMINALLPYLVALIFLTSLTEKWSNYRFIIGLLMFGLGTAGLYRGALIGFIIAIIAILILSEFKKKRLIFISVMIGSILVMLFGDLIIHRMAPSPHETAIINTSGRFTHWPVFYSMFKENPIIGHGPNADMYLYGVSTGFIVAHNEYLAQAVNYGIPGLILSIFPFVYFLIRLFQNRHIPSSQYIILNGIGALLIFFIMSITSNILRTPGSMVLIMLIVAISIDRIREYRRSLMLRSNYIS
jgi:O-antigen ligase